MDVILRRLDADFADPLEMRADSSLGVAGLIEAVRAGTVVMANALGSGLMESMAMKSSLPTLCRHLLGKNCGCPASPAGGAATMPNAPTSSTISTVW